MKRPWLLSQKGQRVSIFISLLISAAMTLSLLSFIQSTVLPRVQITQLDERQITYCELSKCEKIDSLKGLELIPNPDYFQITTGRWFTTVTMRFLNHGQLNGDRELRLVLRSSSGKIVEMANQVATFSPKGRQEIAFTFTGTPEELLSGTVHLGY